MKNNYTPDEDGECPGCDLCAKQEEDVYFTRTQALKAIAAELWARGRLGAGGQQVTEAHVIEQIKELR